MLLISPLTSDDRAVLNRHRDWVWDSVSASPPLDRENLGTAIKVIQALLDDGVGPDETFKLHSLGVVLGDVIAGLIDAPWVMVDDEWGRDAALQVDRADGVLFPVTAIAKRVEAGAAVSVIELVEGLAAKGLEVREAAGGGTLAT